jgi:energy-coupling factor transport system permease protein
MKAALNSYHPAAAFLPFAAVICFTMLSFHPVYSAISLLCAFISALIINGRKAVRLSLLLCLPLFIVTVIINTAFNQNGITVLFYWGDRPIVLEGLVFGICSAAALSAVVLWFSCYSTVIDSEKFLYLSGGISPAVALLVSLTLEQASQMRRKAIQINDAQIGLYGDERKKFKQRLRLAMLKISVLLSWSMEDSLQTADSMHSRGFGTGKSTKMTPYILGRRDISLIIFSMILICICVFYAVMGKISFRYYPVLQDVNSDSLNMIGYLCFLLMFSIPMLVELKEAIKWRYYMLKI